MLRFSQNQSRSMLALLTVMAVALSACGGGSGTPTPSGNGAVTQPSGTTGPNTSGQTGDTGSGLSGASAALAGVESYKFVMTETGGSLGDTLSMLPIPSSGTPSFKISGTVVLRPDKAADITVADTLHVVSIGGFDYQDIGLTGAFTKNESTTPSLIDSLSPDSVFSASFGASFNFGSNFDNRGSESKNGVDSDHYLANDSGKAALAEFGSVAGIAADKWTAEIWVAKSGGYPVRMTVTATSGSSIVYERTFDITKVNDAANKVTVPTNVTGA